MASETKTVSLTATYKDHENEPFTVTKKIPTSTPPSASASASASASVQDRVQFLSALRAAVTETQEQVNKELTSRMQEDIARAATASGEASLVADEVMEEENYGEEVQEEED